ncbi:MAG TPA: MaoC family dehydratase N-terminal domain-containing protein, partial [Burkholderiales bacterium]|nr:MaoC family dehydratase N-terminal domain-containing protein [Burkholderiales bacterium]
GDAMPPGWHWLYFLEAKSASELGPDGHPRRGGFLPPVALPRRMWAGGSLAFHEPLRVGDELKKDTEIVSVSEKTGKTGALVFVTVRHTIAANGKLAVVEDHDIVYREAAKPTDAPAQTRQAPASGAWRREVAPDPVLLFRYSALTFNGHRIHYDLDYVRDEEHYPGLIVHGPLQTMLMLELCRAHAPRPVRKLDYRAQHPVFHTERFSVCGTPDSAGNRAEVWTANGAGAYAMTGTVEL